MWAVVLVALIVVAYLPALGTGFVWDDDDHVTENRALRSAAGLADIWTAPGAVPQYYPLVHTTFWIEYRLFGLDPTGYHAVNIGLHALGALLLWRLLDALLVPGAWLTAAIFAVHPVHVESVAWITERKNVLSAVFYFVAFLTYLRFRPPNDDSPGGGVGLWVAAFSAFAAALLSKTVTGSLPAAVLLVLWWKRGRLTRTDIVPLMPFFVLAFALGGLTVAMEKNHVGASGEAWDLSWVERYLVAGRAVWFYLGKLAWPYPLVFNYPRWDLDAGALAQHIPPLAVTATLAILWIARARIGRGPLVAALFFVGTLVPALGFFDVYPMRYSFVADHFQYLASIGPLAAAVAVARAGVERWGASRAAPAFALAVLVGLATLTWHQTRIYESAEALWSDTLRKNPASSLANNNLALILKARGAIDEALVYYEAAVRHDPLNAEARNNLANVLQTRGRIDDAIAQYREAIRIDPERASAHNGLGIALAEKGDLTGAIASYARALALRPGLAAAHFNLGNALANSGRLEDAVRSYRTALSIEPDLIQALLNLGTALDQLGRTDEALRAYVEVLRREPGNEPALRGVARLRAQVSEWP